MLSSFHFLLASILIRKTAQFFLGGQQDRPHRYRINPGSGEFNRGDVHGYLGDRTTDAVVVSLLFCLRLRNLPNKFRKEWQ